eukprot:TRINITY_DN7854_c2_g1_i1.p1 TRINITY_DN7854_c2_g1~~TRINITY_DN7854_c2_g1_i1.p1  ORF type:complete len:327 (+),score=85.22 TRINITY_DN7854_c2_g1_i1:477-1457(+)
MQSARNDGVSLPAGAYRSLFRSMRRTQREDPDKAVEDGLAEMRRRGLEPDSGCWTEIMALYAAAGDAAGCDRAASNLDGEEMLSERVCLMRIQATVRLDSARTAFVDMLSAGVTPNVRHFTAMLTACRRSRDVAGAEMVLRDMESGRWRQWYRTPHQRRGTPIPADIGFWSQLLAVCSSAGDVEGARSVVRRMGERSLEATEAVFMTFITCCAVAMQQRKQKGLEYESLVADAEAAFEQAMLETRAARSRLYVAMMEVYSVIGDVTRARGLRKRQSDRGIPETPPFVDALRRVFDSSRQSPEPGELHAATHQRLPVQPQIFNREVV